MNVGDGEDEKAVSMQTSPFRSFQLADGLVLCRVAWLQPAAPGASGRDLGIYMCVCVCACVRVCVLGGGAELSARTVFAHQHVTVCFFEQVSPNPAHLKAGFKQNLMYAKPN